MADFDPAYERMVRNEGGYALENVSGDRGGLTYAGISRVFNPEWAGWAAIDRGDIPATSLVRDWYRTNYWVPIQGDAITHQAVAESIFDFAVNTSAPGRPTVAVKLAQLVVNVTPDGVFGPVTLAAVNGVDPALFVARYCVAKVARYVEIVKRDRSQLKFLLGWLSRALRGVS